jgi:hypothetical protein
MTESNMSEAELTQLLVEVWTEALGVEATPESDFFALDGTSLAAVSITQAVVARLEPYDGVESFVLLAVFEQPSLGAMARALSTFVAGAEAGRAAPA